MLINEININDAELTFDVLRHHLGKTVTELYREIETQSSGWRLTSNEAISPEKRIELHEQASVLLSIIIENNIYTNEHQTYQLINYILNYLNGE